MGWIIIAICAVMSAILLSGKGSFLIAGYNTASKKEKSKYDEKKLCRVTGISMGLITILLLLTEFNSKFVGGTAVGVIVIMHHDNGIIQ